MKLTVYYPLRVSCNCRHGGREESYSRRAFTSYHNDTNDYNISADRMPTSEQETGEIEKTTEKWEEGACASPSAASDGGAGGGDARVPPELRAALPNVVWSRQEEKPDGHQEIAPGPGGFQPMRVPKPQLLRDVILNECRDREVRSASDGVYHRSAE